MTPAAPLRVRRILVVDDHAEIHADFRKILCPPEAPPSLGQAKAKLFGARATEAGPPRARFEVHSALQGEEGVRAAVRARAAGEPFQVAFVDMRMPPGWDGVATVKALWEIDPSLQMVVCTAYSDEALDRVAADLGHADKLLVLKKPFEPIEVLQLATALSEKWRAERDAELRVEDLERIVRERTAEIEQSALHDRLTGLPNRALLLNRLAICIDQTARDPSRKFALLFLDLDGFKTINDTLGHEVGDQLLTSVAERLRQSLRPGDVVASLTTPARLGGDEFLLLLEGLARTADAARVAERLLAKLSETFHLGPHRVALTASVGIATSERAYRSAGDLVRDADIAMYRAKSSGRARYVLFDEALHREIGERLALESALRSAVQEDALDLHYQPIVRLEDGRLEGFEALVRWTHPERGPISPAELIGAAEDVGLIQTLGLQLLRRGCRQLAEWHRTIPGAANLRMTVNLSRRQLVDPEFGGRVAEVIRETGVDATKLGLEITESSVLHDVEGAIAVLGRLRELGADLFLDDFGSGYSAISYLHRMPLTGLKIDRTFLKQAHADARYAAALEAVVSIARAFSLGIVAEGIETREQRDLMRSLGIELGQGFLYSRAVPAAEALERTRAGRLMEMPRT